MSSEPLREPRAKVAPVIVRSAASGTEGWFSVKTIGHIIVLAALAAVVMSIVVLVWLHGWDYYRTPLRIRGYNPAHKLLRPSGLVGHWLGITGTILMIVMQLYSVRKRLPRVLGFGRIPHWLEFHIFCGVLGPVLVTYHTSLKFNGIVSVAYWSMMVVMLSGFVGRYLYVRIPKTIRGQELTLGELEAHAAELKQDLIESTLPVELMTRIEAFEERFCTPHGTRPSVSGLVFGDLLLRWRLRRLRAAIRRTGIAHELLERAVALVRERAQLLRRIAYLQRTRRLFELWHVFHRPFAYVMLVVVVIHVAAAIYFGYAFGGGS